jgi:hypothetical protein
MSRAARALARCCVGTGLLWPRGTVSSDENREVSRARNSGEGSAVEEGRRNAGDTGMRRSGEDVGDSTIEDGAKAMIQMEKAIRERARQMGGRQWKGREISILVCVVRV